MTKDPSAEADASKLAELQKEMKRLNREKAEVAAAEAAKEKAATEENMRQELESQKIIADTKSRLHIKETPIKNKVKRSTPCSGCMSRPTDLFQSLSSTSCCRKMLLPSHQHNPFFYYDDEGIGSPHP
ncbi:MAG: hypothetical protein LBU24_00655 [Methanocalculaceae archaeon]|jgi:hypothetical protein|nr:hypothetical protein [Methanocalculaceae archaeon]